MPVSSRYKTQNNNILGLGFYASGKHEFSNPGTNSEKPISDFPIQGEFDFPINWSFRIFEATERAKHQSIGDPQQIVSNPSSRKFKVTRMCLTSLAQSDPQSYPETDFLDTEKFRLWTAQGASRKGPHQNLRVSSKVVMTNVEIFQQVSTLFDNFRGAPI